MLAAVLLLIGVVVLVFGLTVAVLKSTPDTFGVSIWIFSLQLVVATSLIGIGIFWITRLLWQVGVSAERRGALATRANDLELVKEIRQHREDLPTVPRDHYPPRVGRHHSFQLVPSPRNVWGLITAAAASIVLVALVTILILIVASAFDQVDLSRFGEIEKRIGNSRLNRQPWLGAALLIPICLAAGWAVFQFIRQLLKLTGIGITSIEVSGYPLRPGETYQVFLSQSARVRLKLLDVTLKCVEEATYNQGTDIRTEQAVVYESRLFRQRGMEIKNGEAFSTEFDLTIPDNAIHSFKSRNNRVQWKIEVTAQAKSWPRLSRNFAVSVHPRGQIAMPSR